jgi:hypothetical protein
MRGMSAGNALELASKASCLAVGRKGAADSIPFLKEVLDTRFEPGETGLSDGLSAHDVLQAKQEDAI